MKALVYHGPGQRSWDTVPDPKLLEPTDAIVRIDTATICGTDLHILKGDVPEVHTGNDPWPRSGRHDRRDRFGCHDRRPRRPGARLVHHVVRALPVLQGRPLRALHRWRRLDLRPHDRRPTGRVRSRAVRRHVGLQGAGGTLRRGRALPRGHPADGLRGRRSERRRPARRHRRGGRRRPDRARDDHDGEALHARPHRRDRPLRRASRKGAASSGPTRRSTTVAKTRPRS